MARERRRGFDFDNWAIPTEIDLSWMAPAQDGGLDIAGYRVEVSSNNGATWQLLAPQVVGTTYTHRGGLSARTVRKYRVRAAAENGTEGPVAVVEGTTGHGVRRIAVTSQPAAGDAYLTGEKIVVEVTMSTPMTYDAPQLPLLVGGQARNAVCWDGTGSQNGVVECPSGATETLRLSYAVQAGDLDEDGIAVAPDSLTGDQFRRAGPPVATAELGGTGALFHLGAGPFAGHRVNPSPPAAPSPPPTPEVSVSSAPAPVREGEAAVFTLALSQPVQEPVTVEWSTAADAAAHEDDNGTAPAADPRQAAANGDYVPVAAGTVTFATGTMEQTVTVATRTDNRDEYDETFLVRLNSVDVEGVSLDSDGERGEGDHSRYQRAADDLGRGGADPRGRRLGFSGHLLRQRNPPVPEARLVDGGRNRDRRRGLHRGRGRDADRSRSGSSHRYRWIKTLNDEVK